MNKKYKPVIAVAVLVILVAILGIVTHVVMKYIPSSEKMDLNEYYGEMADGEIALVIGTEKLEERGLVDGDRVYLPLDVVNTYLNQRYYWDSANQQILYATPSELTSVSASSEAGDKVWVKDDKVYLNLTYVQEFTDLDAYITKDPYRIAIQYKFKNVKTVTVKKNTSIRYRGGIKSAILTSVKKGTKLRLIEEMENWDQVATDDGYIGYIDKKKVGEAEKTKFERSFKKEEYSYLTMDSKVNMVWHQVTSTDANAYFADATANMTGVNVISPTWFYLTDTSGNIASIASAEIRKPEHTDHHCNQQDMRNQQLFFPELFPARLHDHCFSHPHTSHPRIKKSHQKQHKHYIYHMGMEISQHKGITWKFMDRLVRHIRIVSNITGRIREPVAVRFFSLQLLEPWNDLTVNHIMHISRN